MKKLLAALLLFAFTSCRVSLVPAYSTEAVFMTETASNATDTFYDGIIASPDKSYEAHAPGYENIKARIAQLQEFNSTRKKSKLVLYLLNDISKRFATYETAHKEAGTLNEREILSFKYGMQALWSSLYNAEINFNKPKN